ncbi:MAG: aminotransferase class V-fold PLP-dependent enzyme, partial [Actinomycetia bacterium]|nr:aminotransferase class V-fold PLP-dependent enzyme [Actinomycetes bacterium]
MPNDVSCLAETRAAFIDGSDRSYRDLRDTVDSLLEVLIATDRRPTFPATPASDLREAMTALDPLPENGRDVGEVLAEVGSTVLGRGVRMSDPHCAAHLHPPPLLAAAVAELASGVTNQSMDSFEQSPAATYVEERLIDRLNALLGMSTAASGVLTSGGTASNLLGLLLARDAADLGSHANGLPESARTWRILTSTAAHASIRQAADVLGLGRVAVVPVDTDRAGRMDPEALDRCLDEVIGDGQRPIAIAATAGTTDSGAIDPLDAIADRAERHGLWFHVDAAV